MIVLEHIAQVRKALDGAGAVGFVPTMGALHAGHVSLIERARAECDVVVVSIFVNPAQFGPHEDLDAYPRTLDADLQACERAGADVVFVPQVREMYPEQALTTVSVAKLGDRMEGGHRPAHFDGVTLVVAKLFSIVGPCRAYFGEKDAQQLRVVRRMAADLDLPVDVVACPTVRDRDGLALSSRNVYLSAEERARALCLPRALLSIRDAVAAGETDVPALLARAGDELNAADVVDYLECVDPVALEPVRRIDGEALVCAAIRVGGTRLIDNILIGGRT